MSCAFQESLFGFKQYIAEILPDVARSATKNFDLPSGPKGGCVRGWIKRVLFGRHLGGYIHLPYFCQWD